MNYQRIYNNLTSKDMIASYTEKHHIIPICMGGNNDPSNLVCLTPEAHYVAHQLLVKIYPDNDSLIYAACMMTMHSNGQRVNNKLFDWLRQKRSNAMKGNTHQNGRKASSETRIKMSNTRKGVLKSAEHRAKIGAGNKGKSKPQQKVTCPHCNKTGSANNMKRYHFDNCKWKINE